MILRHTNDRVTKKHHIKPPSLESTMAMQQLSETFSNRERSNCIPSSQRGTRRSPTPSGLGKTRSLCNPMWLKR